MLGNGRLEAMCIDSTKRLCHIRGKMRKKVWVNTVRVGVKQQCWYLMVSASRDCLLSLLSLDTRKQSQLVLITSAGAAAG